MKHTNTLHVLHADVGSSRTITILTGTNDTVGVATATRASPRTSSELITKQKLSNNVQIMLFPLKGAVRSI